MRLDWASNFPSAQGPLAICGYSVCKGEQEADGVPHLHPCVVFFTFAGRCASAH